MRLKLYIAVFVFLTLPFQIWCQEERILDSNKVKVVQLTVAPLLIGSLVGLATTWYSKKETSSFHLYNDNASWLQMDKAGHAFAAYNIGYYSMEAMKWAGINQRKSVLHGGAIGFTYLLAVEVMDGFSKNWGFSVGDIASNFTGTALLIGQEFAFEQQHLRLKYSYHDNKLPDYRRSVLGENQVQQLLKDYNGQTYWASVNLRSITNADFIPPWINLALGYGATGMVSAEGDVLNFRGVDYQFNRYRQYYLSLDIALEKIKTKSSFANAVLKTFSILKIPFPTLEYNRHDGLRTHLIYF